PESWSASSADDGATSPATPLRGPARGPEGATEECSRSAPRPPRSGSSDRAPNGLSRPLSGVEKRGPGVAERPIRSRETMSKTVNKRKGDVGQAGNAGQWAALNRSESDVLVDLPEDTENPPMVRVVGWSSNKKLQEHLGEEEALLTPEEVAASAEFLDEDHLLENIERTARSNCMRRGAMEHYDDVVGDTAHDIIARIRKGEDRDRNISAVATRALLSRIAGGHLAHRLGNGEVVSTPTREAQKKLKARIAQIEQEEHRHVSGREADAIADEIRMSFKAGRRPEEGFHVAGTSASGRQSRAQTYGEEGSGDTFGSMIAEGGAVSRTDHRDTTSERALAERERPYEDVYDPGAMQAPELLFAIK